MKKVYCFLFAFAFLAQPLAQAAGSSASASAPATSQFSESSSQEKFEDNHKITDSELRSRAGSLSRFSVRGNISYYGPTLTDFSVANQPNPDGTVSASAVGPSGSLGVRYRLDDNTSVTANAGITGQYLFTNKPFNLDVNNPFITFDKSFNFHGLQMVASPGVTLVTSNVYRKVGETAGLDARLYTAYRLGDSDFTLGASTTASYYFFNRDYQPNLVGANGKTIYRDGKVRRISVTVAPVIKYNITEKWNVNTSFGFNFFNARSENSATRFNSRLVNEWVGMGYALTRGIYLSPYVQFYPTQFNWKTATVNMSTVVSLL
jgi:hypothetical protein